jgi:hypothetical protein
VEAGGVGISRFTENMEVIEKQETLKPLKSPKWANVCTWRVRGTLANYFEITPFDLCLPFIHSTVLTIMMITTNHIVAIAATSL